MKAIVRETKAEYWQGKDERTTKYPKDFVEEQGAW